MKLADTTVDPTDLPIEPTDDTADLANSNNILTKEPNLTDPTNDPTDIPNTPFASVPNVT